MLISKRLLLPIFAGIFFGIAGAQTTPAPHAQFDVASIRPNTANPGVVRMGPARGGRFTATNVNLKQLIGVAWNVRPFEISGGPSWVDSTRYDVDARSEDSNLPLDKQRTMLRALLEDRFQLKVHREPREIPVYSMTAAKGGLKLPETKADGCTPLGPNAPPPPPPSPGGKLPNAPCGAMLIAPNRLEGSRISMAQLVNSLSNILGRSFVDNTGFPGTFDVHLDFSPEGTNFPGHDGGPPLPGDTSAPTIFTALQEQLGLKLDSQKLMSEILLIDHVEKASEN